MAENKPSQYENISDEELIERYRAGETGIIDYLMVKYKNLVLSKTRSLFILGGESEDLIQEGMIGLFQAVNDYDFGRDASFFTFADLCISRKVYSAIKASNDKKHSFLNNYISFFGGEHDEGKENTMTLIEQLPGSDESDPEKFVLTAELKERLEKAFREDLTPLEREAFGLYITGMKAADAAKIMGKSVKETDNAIQRSKKKLKKIRLQ
ncbi:MAG: sigma-70 family RNA polymerase sigma factor [Lachnospiraceae bacterium]|nr:sigma-70 family RNA polymerase sigma factor [Lachnospiraceae bacterium]